jgi:hypothetical protein
MKMDALDRRMKLWLVLGGFLVLAVAIRYGVYRDTPAPVVEPTGSIPAAETRLQLLRQTASKIPGKETVLKQVKSDLEAREKGIVTAGTSAQAKAQLIDTIRRIATAEGIDARGAEELREKAITSDYGEVSVAVTFTCRIEQLVNFLSALANDPQMLASNEMHVSQGNAKDKSVQVRLSVSGVVPRKLVPEKKGVTAF